jgi:hypothetical protein
MSKIAAGLQIPDSVAQIASEQRLGRLQAVHTGTYTRSLHVATGVVAIIIGVAINGAYLLSYSNLFSWLPWWQSIIIPLIGIIWVIVGCWTIFAPFFNSRLTVYAYSEGLLVVNRNIEVLPWSSMERIWRLHRSSSKKPDQVTYVIRRSDERLFEFGPQLSMIAILGSLIEREITQRLLPRAITAYTRGETVLFDAIALDGRGILLRDGRKTLPWPDLAKLTINEESLEWFKRDEAQPWAVIPLDMVPNVEILRNLVIYAQSMLKRETVPKIVAYRAGATVDFGALHVNQQGISLSGSTEFIPWNKIASIGVSEQEVIVGRKDTGQWYTFPDWMIRDAAILKDLVEYILQKKKV